MAKTANFYNKERQNYYNSIISSLDTNAKTCDEDFKTFVEKYFKQHTQDEFGNFVALADFHLEMVDRIEKEDKLEAIVEMARNHAKTTVFGLFLPIYLMLKKKINCFLLISSNKDAAVKQLINIQKELETNQELINDYGEFQKKGNWSQGNFIVDRYNCAFYCLGKGQSVRGIRYKNHRPDFILIDDIDTDEEVMNPNIVTKQTNWVIQSVIPAMALKRFKFVVLGNKFAPDMVLSRLQEEIEDIEIIKVNALDEEGNINWYQRFTTDDINRIRKKLGPIRFAREYMNTPIIEGSVFQPEYIAWTSKLPKEFEYVVTYIDPSYKDRGDFKAAITLGYKNTFYYVIDIFLRQTSMENLFNYLYKIYTQSKEAKWNIRMYIEANFNQDTHKITYKKIEKVFGISLPLSWDTSKKDNKVVRIETLLPYLEQQKFLFYEKYKETADYKQFFTEYISFPTYKHDDGLDALHSAQIEIEKRIRIKNTSYMTGARNRTTI